MTKLAESGGRIIKTTDPVWRAGLQQRVQFALDMQRVRQQIAGRLPENLKGEKKKRVTTVELSPEDLSYMRGRMKEVLGMEKSAFKDVEHYMKGASIWEEWIRRVKGVGP